MLIGFTILATLAVLGGAAASAYFKFRVVIPVGHIGWDGENVYPPGRPWSIHQIDVLSIEENITTFGEDELGIIQVVDTHRYEYGTDNYAEKNGSWTRSMSESVTTRAPKTYKNRKIIVWKPDEKNIRTYLRSGHIPSLLAELLRTVPTVELERYEDKLGINILSTEGIEKTEASAAVGIGEGVDIPYEARDKTVYILGRPGMGKSTLLLSMARQDIVNGRGVGVIDPHGDLIADLLPHIPRRRVKDVILLDAASLPIGINFFSVKSDTEKELVSQDVLAVFKRLSDTPGERMETVLYHTVRTLAEWPEATFLDIYRFLTDDYFRDSVVRSLRVDYLADFWRDVFSKYPHPATEQPIITRMGKFNGNETLRTITGTRSPLNIHDAMQKRKIVLCSIPKPKIGMETSAILGALLVSQFQLAAMRRGSLPARERVPFYLYIDEFQNFQTSAFNEIMTESRKYQLCLTLANQKLADLEDKTRGAVQGAETFIYFRPFDEDANRVAKNLTKFTADDLLNLDEHHAVVRQGKASNVSKIEIEPPPKAPRGYVEEIIDHTRTTYPSTPPLHARSKATAVTREDVEPGAPPE